MTEPDAGPHAEFSASPIAFGVPARYAGEWALFRDWCTATKRTALPANPSDVEAFLIDCPAASATVARRLTAIAAVQRAAGLAVPEWTDPVRDAARGRSARARRQPIDPDRLAQALRMLPSHGWTEGWFGRRDRALLVLVGAGLSYRAIARLTAADIEVRVDSASISANGASVVVPGGDDPVSCPSCALVRWLRTLDFAVTRLNSTRSIAAALTRAAPLTSESKHLCQSTKPATSDNSRAAPLLPPIDQWGSPSGEVASLTAASVSKLARSIAAGQLAKHRELAVEPHRADQHESAHALSGDRGVTAYSPEQWRHGIERRHDAVEQMRSLDQIFDDFDFRAAELERRTLELLANI